MEKISTIQYQPGFARAPYDWIAINGVAIEKWCAERLNYPDALSLGLAQIWVVDGDELQLARRRIMPGEDCSSTVVPILVCSDDMDFGCTVVVVEQLVIDGTVQWLRWGHSLSSGSEVGITTKWASSGAEPLAVFNQQEFMECLNKFAPE
ncbi:hypothetical protein [Massilia sp. BJB1822]|uniref:hypothetical protein n=1 Tax=Massilia sp. BJB1822 TaxID=2744470 RepID=UPI00159492F7|nr:hypothetical protein [Massilia sp. BJB1822]NVD97550.1 hypothetical protein [Massilia sp. BJB1822]